MIPTKTTEPAWLLEGRRFNGLREIPGSQHEPKIVQFWKDIKRGGIKDDETPWCAAFVGAMLERVGVRSTRFESAKSYLDWGVKLDEPTVGCVVIFSRTGGGHVGFVVGKTAKGELLVLGGNQSNAVNVRAFDPKSKTFPVVGYRWPVETPVVVAALPVGTAAGASSVV